MILSPKQGTTVYFKNPGRLNAAPILCGKIRVGKPFGGIYWEVDIEGGGRTILFDYEMFASEEEVRNAE